LAAVVFDIRQKFVLLIQLLTTTRSTRYGSAGDGHNAV
jgi:hypothetical protein